LTYELIHYAHFFEIVLFETSKRMIEELVCVIEYRHIFGMVFDDNGPLTADQEMEIFYRVESTLRIMYDKFRIRVIITSLKFKGGQHFIEMVDEATSLKKQEHRDMIAGFDLVCEEDACPTLDSMLPEIYQAK